MEIKVLGSGCKNCQLLFRLAGEAIGELGIDANLEKVEDMGQILSFGVMTTPALVINGKVAVSGRVPGKDQIKRYLQEAVNKS